MGITNTAHSSRVAWIDTVTQTAFGPTFADAEDAEACLQWIADKTTKDLRAMTDKELEGWVQRWRNEVYLEAPE